MGLPAAAGADEPVGADAPEEPTSRAGAALGGAAVRSRRRRRRTRTLNTRLNAVNIPSSPQTRPMALVMTQQPPPC